MGHYFLNIQYNDFLKLRAITSLRCGMESLLVPGSKLFKAGPIALTLDGNSEIGEHKLSEISSLNLQQSTILDLKIRGGGHFLHTCATYSELPSSMSTLSRTLYLHTIIDEKDQYKVI